MKYCTREELLHRNTPVRTHDLQLPSGRCLKVVPLLPEIRARFPKLDPWKKLVAALHFGIIEPKLSVNDVVAFLNTAPMEAVAAGKRILQLSADYDRPEAVRKDETEHFFAALEGIAEMRGER